MKKFLGSFENRAPGSSLQRGVCLKLRDCACSTPVTASVRVKAQLLMTAFSHHRLRMTDCKSLTSSITNRTVGTILVCFEYSLIKSQNLVFSLHFLCHNIHQKPRFYVFKTGNPGLNKVLEFGNANSKTVLYISPLLLLAKNNVFNGDGYFFDQRWHHYSTPLVQTKTGPRKFRA